jgi:hypothetical protein
MPKVSSQAMHARGTRALRGLAAGASLGLAAGPAACGGANAHPATHPAAASSATPAGAAPQPAESAANAPTAPTSSFVSPPPPPPPDARSTKVTARRDPAWAACHAGYEAKRKDVSRDVEAMAAACAKVTTLKVVGKTLTGKQSDQDPPQSFPLKAEGGHCYRVYAQGSEGIRDLDLAIKDSTGAVAAEDSTDDASPVVLEDGLVCFKETDAAVVVVSVGLGKGTYALSIASD